MTLSGEIILLVFLGLLLAVAGYEIKKWVGGPVAPILLIIGIILRVVGEYIPQLQESVELVNDLDPKMVLLVIMPALIFEASLATDWYTFKQELAQIIPMATSAVLVSTILTGVVIKLVFNYDFTWQQAIIFGVVLSATDHVAVVSQLKEVYASKRLETLISGETLLNEATVLVIFEVMVESVKGEYESGDSAIMFFRLSLGGFVLGIVFSLALGFILNRMINDDVGEITMTITSGYLIFFVADGTPLAFSGAIAVVTLGLYMSAYGKTLISPVVEHILHGFWKVIGTNIESLVFILGGMLLGMHFVKASIINWTDVGYMVAMFGLLYVIRAIVVLIHYPVLRYFGYGLNYKEAIVVIAAGSKGAIATALALIAYNEEELDEDFRSILLFYTVAIAALTIVIGTFFIKIAVKCLGLETLTETQERMLIGVTTAILKESTESIEVMKRENSFKLTDWEKVLNLAGPENLMKQVLGTTEKGKDIIEKNPNENVEFLLKQYYSQVEKNEENLIYETRKRFFTTLKGIYWQEFVSGHCLGDTVLILMNSANRSCDNEKEDMNDWEMIQTEISSPVLLNIYIAFSKVPCIGGLFRSLIYEKMTTTYDICNTFVNSHHLAEELMDEMEIDIDPKVFKEVMVEAEKNVVKCMEFVRVNITDGYPEIISGVQSKIACHSLLLGQRNLLTEIYEQGVVQELEYKYLVSAIDKNIKRITFHGKPELPSPHTILKNRFPRATPEQIEQLCEDDLTRVYQKDDFLFKSGAKNEGAYLIMNGRVKEMGNWIDQELRIGNIVGVQHLLEQYRHEPYNTFGQAIGIVRAARLPSDLITNRNFSKELYNEASEEIILLNKEILNLNDVDPKDVYHVVSKCKVEEVEAGASFNAKTGGVLLEGKVGEHTSVHLIQPKKEMMVAETFSIVLVFPEQLGNALLQHIDPVKAFHIYAVYAKQSGLYKHHAGMNLNFGVNVMKEMATPKKE